MYDSYLKYVLKITLVSLLLTTSILEILSLKFEALSLKFSVVDPLKISDTKGVSLLLTTSILETLSLKFEFQKIFGDFLSIFAIFEFTRISYHFLNTQIVQKQLIFLKFVDHCISTFEQTSCFLNNLEILKNGKKS